MNTNSCESVSAWAARESSRLFVHIESRDFFSFLQYGMYRTYLVGTNCRLPVCRPPPFPSPATCRHETPKGAGGLNSNSNSFQVLVFMRCDANFALSPNFLSVCSCPPNFPNLCPTYLTHRSLARSDSHTRFKSLFTSRLLPLVCFCFAQRDRGLGVKCNTMPYYISVL